MLNSDVTRVAEPDILLEPGSQQQLELVARKVAEQLAQGKANVLGTVQAEDEETGVSWRTDALCRDTSPELFFPVGATGLAIELLDDAIAVCKRCPAQEPCLTFALTTNQDSGVWGAASEEQRRDLRRRFLRNSPRR